MRINHHHRWQMMKKKKKKKTHTHTQTHARSNVYTMDMPLCVNGLIFDKMIFLLHSD